LREKVAASGRMRGRAAPADLAFFGMTADRERLTRYAKAMRRGPVANERALWKLLRNRRLGGLKFRRQVPIGR
jgi:very-short-patch-repair endonuclease